MKICLLVFPSQTSKTDMIDVLQPLKIEYYHTFSIQIQVLNGHNLFKLKQFSKCKNYKYKNFI